MIVIGASIGGLRAVSAILRLLKKEQNEPIAVVMHRAKNSEDLLASVLQHHSALTVVEALDKDPLEPGKVYVAPPDYHLLVEKDCFSLSVEAPVNFARPSIDVLFESAAIAHGMNTLAIALTGSSADGAAGAAAVAERGGQVVVQTPATAESSTLPDAVLRAVRSARQLSLTEIAAFLNQRASPHI